MNNTKFFNILKQKLDDIKEKTLYPLLSKDEDYLKLSTQVSEAENNYIALELPSEQKVIVDHFLEINDSCNMEYSTLNYLAGLIDGQRLGNLMPPILQTEEDNRTAIRKFYYGLLQPCAEQCETPETIQFLKNLSELEGNFASTLTQKQATDFEHLISKTQEGIGYSMADSFIYDFQLSAKLLMTLYN